MNWQNVLEQEHANIQKLLTILDEISIEVLHTKTLDVETIKGLLHLLQTYADEKHHQKEENTVFAMLKEHSEQGRILVENGMLVEHQMARYYVKQMQKYAMAKLDDTQCVQFIGYAQAYIDLLKRHIDKENHVAFPFAARQLDQSLLEENFQKVYEATQEDEALAFVQAYYNKTA